MFQKCSLCNNSWNSQVRFLADPYIQYAGYQVNFKKHELGFLLFNHFCGTTMAFHVHNFINLYKGPIYMEVQTGKSICRGFCLNEKDTRICHAECKFAYARHIIQSIIHTPKEII